MNFVYPEQVTASLEFYRSELFHDVQMAALFDDSKTFADVIPKEDFKVICQQYLAEKESANFDLQHFVLKHFVLPEHVELGSDSRCENVEQQIELLWQILKKPADKNLVSSLIPLKKPYSVPGGRFREIYYWDSYFTALGLIASDREQDVVDMINNFIDLQSQLNVIPNGNRSYYFSRSQPPILALLISLIIDGNAERQGQNEEELKRFAAALEKEYAFWMCGQTELSDVNRAHKRVVRMADGEILNRYWDNESGPRPESYLEDIELAEKVVPSLRPQFYRNIRAACESGWDFSSRWMRDPDSLFSIKTTYIVPVDLNVLLFKLEQTLSELYRRLAEDKKAELYGEKAKKRQGAINKYLWCHDKSFYFDYDLEHNQLSQVWSLAGITPMFAELCSKAQAEQLQQHLDSHFLKTGGLVTTLTSSKQQWDSPNGWAPLHWFAVHGLRQYGHEELASRIIEAWLNTVESYYRKTGKLMEKYDVCEPNVVATGGEYEVQDGFGWTNGITKNFYLLKQTS